MAKKSSSGYHLNGLFVGSEGTLGVFTEITLKLHGIPEHITQPVVHFQLCGHCVEAAISILAAGIPIARVELVDARSIKQVNHFNGTDYPEAPSLFLEFHGNKAGNEEDIRFVQSLFRRGGLLTVLYLRLTRLNALDLWKARHEFIMLFINTVTPSIDSWHRCLCPDF